MPRPTARAARWSWITGEKGRNRVRVFTQPDSGLLYLEWYESVPGRRPRSRSRGLGHRNREEAKGEAEAWAAQLRQQAPTSVAPTNGPLLLGTLFDSFEQAMQDVGRLRKIHTRVGQRFRTWFGPLRAVHTLDEHELERYTFARRSGKVEFNGKPQRPVRARVVEEELVTLRTVLRWAMRRRTATGAPLLASMPILEWKIPREENPRRVQLSAADLNAMLRTSLSIDARLWLALVLCQATGHRINSVRQLRWADIQIDARVITWQGEHQKNGATHQTPIPTETADALRQFEQLERMAGENCDGWLFPAPNRTEPMCRDRFYRWWRACRKAAGLPAGTGAGFHCFRRKLASDLSTAPLAMVKALGGWKHPQVVIDAYQTPSIEQQRAVLDDRARYESGT